MTPETDDVTIATAEEFARQTDEAAAARAHQLHLQRMAHRVSVTLAAIWAPVIMAGLAFVAFLVWQVTSQNTERQRDRDELKSRQVTVWCYADPNTDRATSSFTGSADQVKGRCPDAYEAYR